jgi:hypothetical protein
MVHMMSFGFQVAGLLADLHRAELLRDAARRSQLMAARKVSMSAAVATRSDLDRAAVPTGMIRILAGMSSVGSNRP